MEWGGFSHYLSLVVLRVEHTLWTMVRDPLIWIFKSHSKCDSDEPCLGFGGRTAGRSSGICGSFHPMYLIVHGNFSSDTLASFYLHISKTCHLPILRPPHCFGDGSVFLNMTLLAL